MSERMFGRILTDCILIVLCIGIYGCFKPTDWPALGPEEKSATANFRATKVIIIERNAAPDANAPAASQGENIAPAEAEVRQASERFYAAMNSLSTGDAGQMDDVWSHSPDVTNVSPSGGLQVGWQVVSAAFQQQAQTKSGENIVPGALTVELKGELAYTLCIEQVSTTGQGGQSGTERRANNIFRREDGKWKLIHRHTGPMSGIKKAADAVVNEPPAKNTPPEKPAEPLK